MLEPALLNEWLAIPPEDLAARARLPVRILPTPQDVHRAFAYELFAELKAARDAGRDLAIIVPVGPTGQYPILAEQITASRLSLDRVTFFGMDNWLDWEGRPLPAGDPMSLEGTFHRLLLDRLDPALRPRPENVIFPTPLDLDRSAREIERRGGVSTTYGGFGFQGHLAFNEPPSSRWTKVTVEQLRASHTRVLPVSVDTVIAHAERSAGANVFAIPPMAITLGMRELLGARRIRLYTDTGAWKRTILRILLFSDPDVDYPVTLVQGHADVEVVVDRSSAECPVPAR